MTDTVISTYSTTPITLVDNDTLYLIDIGSLVTSDVAVTWDLDSTPDIPPGVVITNYGMIYSTGDRAFETDNDPDGPQALYLTNYGTIGSSADDALKIGEDLEEGSVIVIENFGSIMTEGTGGDNGQALDLNDLETVGATIINHALAEIKAADADAMRPGNGSIVTNYGWIYGGAEDPTDGNDGVDFQDYGGTVYNMAGGLIEGTRHGITGDGASTVENHGEIVGHRGGGLNFDTASDTTTTVKNWGSITGTAEGDQDGDGIDVDGLADIENYGLIEAFGTWDDGLSEAITIGGGQVTNSTDGIIRSVERAINVDDSEEGSAFDAFELINAGLIEAGNFEAVVIIGDQDDTISNLAGGEIIGSVFTDAGMDTFNLFAGSMLTGAIDGGDDEDSIYLFGETPADEGTLNATVNVERLVVESGQWTIAASQSFSDEIIVESLATLILGDGVELGGDIELKGLLKVMGTGLVELDQEIGGMGDVELYGGGTFALSSTANSYAGGTQLTGEGTTLRVEAMGAAGTGAIGFGTGGQTLVLDELALASPIALAGYAFSNSIEGFGEGDAIVLEDMTFAAGAKAEFDGSTGKLTVSSYGETVELELLDPDQSSFTVENDGEGGSQVVLKNVGVEIRGTNKDNKITATKTPNGQDLPTDADDVIRSRGGDDKVAGLGGNDDIKGGKDNDTLKGGLGDDWLNGGFGKNKLNGGDGYDAFVFDTKLGKGKDAPEGAKFSYSIIKDFEVGADLVLLSQKIFKGLDTGPLDPSQFENGKKASGDDATVLYHKKSGKIAYDKDGSGGKDAVVFAKVDKGTDLSADDFLVI